MLHGPGQQQCAVAVRMTADSFGPSVPGSPLLLPWKMLLRRFHWRNLWYISCMALRALTGSRYSLGQMPSLQVLGYSWGGFASAAVTPHNSAWLVLNVSMIYMRRLTLLSGLRRGQQLPEAGAVGWQIMAWQTRSCPNSSLKKNSWGLPSPGGWAQLWVQPGWWAWIWAWLCEAHLSGQGSTAAPTAGVVPVSAYPLEQGTFWLPWLWAAPSPAVRPLTLAALMKPDSLFAY